MNQKKVELLAPAGDFACFQAAINAGADAVYLGGEKFGARAFAHNFTDEEIIEAIKVAHLFGRKIYLTVNTLVKEKEIDQLIPYITPLYQAGLDGVIIQDIGVLMLVREHFPGLELHASTQMTITGVYGAAFLKKLGVCRVVPARELSLEEIKDIKEQTGLSIETFIHGAMCYAYSGQCLFSSILGGRSGNRGRCAGPCRLPYQDDKGNIMYPLSLKDMYTLPIIPKLIEAGIDSFKIEGRMKSPEYVAGVTALYRKYIDAYISDPAKPYKVSRHDEDILRGLYIRTDICRGYYEQHNSKEMVTLKEAGYLGSNDSVLTSIRSKYLDDKKTLPVQGSVTIQTDAPSKLTLFCGDTSVTITGEKAGEAINHPLTPDDIRNRISKMGDTYFVLTNLEINTDCHSFLPVKAMNELRRQACTELETALLRKSAEGRSRTPYQEHLQSSVSVFLPSPVKYGQLYSQISTIEQFEIVLTCSQISGIYMSADLFTDSKTNDYLLQEMNAHMDKTFYLALPHILRKRSYSYLAGYQKLLLNNIFSGVLVRNLEELQWLIDIDYKGQIIADYHIYSWNIESFHFYDHYFTRHTMSVELNKKELAQLRTAAKMHSRELCIYGRLPLMFSANCVRKTLADCNAKSAQPFILTDRYRNYFPVVQNCHHCYNILYNTVPLSLHGQINGLLAEQYGVYRLDFTLENAQETSSILDYYSHIWKGEGTAAFPCADYTNGHYKRGVE